MPNATQLHTSDQQTLLDINNAIVANLDRPSLFAAVADAMVKARSVDRATLVLHDPTQDTLKVCGLVGTSTSAKSVKPLGTEFPREGTRLADVMRERLPYIRSDLQTGLRTEIEEGLYQSGLRSYVAIPLTAKSKVLGTLNLASRRDGEYSSADAEFLLKVGNQVALAIENMLAYEKIEELQQQLALENEYLREQESSARGFGDIVGDSPGLRQVLEQVELVAPTDANVLIFGESGTGKELIGRAVHERSHHRDGPLILVNCAAIPHELFESEFFGHVRGAFTGAMADRAGRFQLADGGTLFLDEVGEIPTDLQSKLLRVLESGMFERVGEEQTRSVNVRVIAATNRDLREAIDDGRFREDLYYRLSVFPVQLPPLRERVEDIPLLARHFVDVAAGRLGRTDVVLPEQSVQQLCDYGWPGNVRELQNIIERAVIISRDGLLRFDKLEGVGQASSDEPTDEFGRAADTVLNYDAIRVLERDNIERALEQANWKIAGPGGAAQRLGVKPTTLTAKLKAFGLRRPPRA